MVESGGGGRVETLTVLFTDLVGSTALRSRIGEEQSDHLRYTHDGLVHDRSTQPEAGSSSRPVTG